jgi:hypothetical protein
MLYLLNPIEYLAKNNDITSNLVFVEDHIWNTIDNRVLSLTVGAYQLALNDVGLNNITFTSSMIL